MRTPEWYDTCIYVYWDKQSKLHLCQDGECRGVEVILIRSCHNITVSYIKEVIRGKF